MNELGEVHSPSDAPPEYQDDQEISMESPPAEKHQAAWDSGLDAFRDAREIVRLIQCFVCSQPLTHPVVLPCGNSLCRSCLPHSYTRGSISYPNTPDRREGFHCPFSNCATEHPMADCSVDFTLRNILRKCERELQPPTIGDTIWSSFTGGRDGGSSRNGRFAATWGAAKSGRLSYHADMDFSGEEDPEVDHKLLKRVMEKARPELECQVCYALLFDPVTTRCGHTFCRKCLQRVLDHAQPCPSCRQDLQLPSVLPPQLSNRRLTEILVGLCPDALAERAANANSEEQPGSTEDELTTPVFVCTASFPGMPTPLYIFEPKYRLMVRRALEKDRIFGMVLPNPGNEPQEELGQVGFMQNGTLLYIEHAQMNEDGTSSIWTVGLTKFKIRRWGMRDGYLVANTERLDDIPIAEEEARELRETSSEILPRHLDHLSTESLRRICEDSIQRFRSGQTERYRGLVEVFGDPPADPAMLPYWICTVLPIDPILAYRVISSTSVRERLKICATCIKGVESQRWFSTPNCTMF